MPADLASDEARRAAAAALAEWGCPRPDKTHFLTEQHADTALARATRRHHDTHDPTARTYQCPCGGWVWGRRPRKDRTP